MALSENIKYLRKQKGITQEQFAQQVGIKRSLIGSYEEGRAEPKLQTLSVIAEVFGISTDQLINDDLTKTMGILPSREKLKILAVTVDAQDRENIELVPQKAAAGYLNGYADPEYISELPRFRLPILPENATYRAFEISGDSMLPIHSGTIIIGKYIESAREVKNGKTYVLVTSKEGVVYKRVFNYLDERGKLFLVSDNKTYSAYELDPADIQEIWEAKAFISIQFPDAMEASELSLEKLGGMVMNLQKEVIELKDKIKDQ